MNSKSDNRAKEPYEKPQLRAIELAADEVLAAGCKTNKVGTAMGGPTCLSNQCVKNGS